MFYKKGVLRKSRKNHRKIPVPESLSQSSFRPDPTQVFSLQFCKNFKNTFFGEHVRGNVFQMSSNLKRRRTKDTKFKNELKTKQNINSKLF